ITNQSEGSIYCQCLEGLHVRIAEVGQLVVPGMFGSYTRAEDWWDPNLLVSLPLFVFLWLGWVNLIRQQPDVFLVTFPLYIALYVYWPFNQAGRYFSPVLSVILLCLWSAPQNAHNLAVAISARSIGRPFVCLRRPLAIPRSA